MADTTKAVAGERYLYEMDGVEYLSTVLNTYTDEEGNDKATLSLLGTDIILSVDNSFNSEDKRSE